MTGWDDSRYFDASDGVRIHYRDSGGDGEPVLFVHGYTASIGGQWGRPGLIAGIRDAGWRTIAFDLRGHGLSDKPHSPGAYAGYRMGADAIELLDHLGLGAAHIVAYSLGAHLMLHTLVGPATDWAMTVTLGGAAGRWNWTDADTRAVQEEAEELETGSICKHILRLWPASKPAPGGEELQELSRRKLQGMDALALAAIKLVMPHHQVSRAQIKALSMPLMGVVGTLDPQLQAFRELKSFAPQMKLVEVDGAGHGDCPGKPEFLKALSEFLTEHAAGRP